MADSGVEALSGSGSAEGVMTVLCVECSSKI